MENENENLDSLNEDNETADSINGEEVDAEVLKTQLADTKEKNKKLFERAKTAEGFVKDLTGKWVKKEKPVEKPEKPEEKKEELSLKDVRDIKALSDVHEDDMEWLVNWAKFNGVSVAEAKKTKEAQEILRIKAEERRTAEATNVAKSGKTTSKITGDDLLEKALKENIVPDENDDEAIHALVEARQRKGK